MSYPFKLITFKINVFKHEMQYSFKNGLLSKMPHSEPQSHNSLSCNAVQLQWKNLFKFFLNWEYSINHGQSIFNQAFLIPNSSPILNFLLPKVSELDVTKSYSVIP